MLGVVVFLLALVAPISNSCGNGNKLLVILLDGFRWDYTDNNLLLVSNGFQTLMQNGVRAEYMKPVYPSESYPGYYAFQTGLFGEDNGFPLNYMYDTDKQQLFAMLPNNNSFWWEEAEPLWITTTKLNIPTGSFHWPGGHIPINGTLPKIYSQYSSNDRYSSLQLHNDIGTAISLLANDTIQFAQIYAEFTDFYGHVLGPDAVKTGIIPLADAEIKYLMDEINENNLGNKLNVIVVSDHGMTNTAPASLSTVKTIRLTDVISTSDVDYPVLDRGSHIGIFPAQGKEDYVYTRLQTLEGVKVYKKADIPEEYHIKNSSRVPPIFVEVIPGYYLIGMNDSKQVPQDPLNGTVVIPGYQYNGFHGYYEKLLKDMEGIFMATGPDFKKNVVIPPFRIVDPYNLMLCLLGVNASDYPNQGIWDNIKGALL